MLFDMYIISCAIGLLYQSPVATALGYGALIRRKEASGRKKNLKKELLQDLDNCANVQRCIPKLHIVPQAQSFLH